MGLKFRRPALDQRPSPDTNNFTEFSIIRLDGKIKNDHPDYGAILKGLALFGLGLRFDSAWGAIDGNRDDKLGSFTWLGFYGEVAAVFFDDAVGN